MQRAALEAIAFLVLLGLCLFLPAGRLDWPMGWAVLAGFGLLVLGTFLRVDPGLIRERASPGPGVVASDVALASLGFLALYPATLIVSALDAQRFVWSEPLPLALQLLALLVFGLGYGFACWALLANPFFATFVRIQEDRGHRVVTAGPYAWVRHPGYAGTLVAHLALPLALGSRWGLAPAVIGFALFVARTALEDRTLAARLPGYRAYQERVPWRLFPYVW